MEKKGHFLQSALTLVGCMIVACVEAKSGSAVTSSLVQNILAAADPKVRPDADDTTKPTLVSIGFTLNSLEKSLGGNSFRANGFVALSWNDPRLGWDPANYTVNITHIPIDIAEIWTPDITLFNSAEANMATFSAEQNLALVYPDGTVFWVPKTSVQFRTNATDHPVEYTGELFFGSWVLSADQLDVVATMDTVETSAFDWDSDYVIRNSSILHRNVYYPKWQTAYPRLEVTLTISPRTRRA